MVSREKIRGDIGDGILSMRAIAEKNGCSLRTVYRIASEKDDLTPSATGTETAREELIQAIKSLLKGDIEQWK